MVNEWKEDRILLSEAFEHRHVSLCGRALAAFSFAVWQGHAQRAALNFWGGNAARRLLLLWRTNVLHQKQIAAQTSQVIAYLLVPPKSRITFVERIWSQLRSHQ
jgi:hypothetical protein